MTIESAAARPYRVFTHALQIDLFHNVGPRIGTAEFADAGLTAAEHDLLDPDLGRRLYWARIAARKFTWLAALTLAIFGVFGFFASDFVVGAALLAGALALTAAGSRGVGYLKSVQRELEATRTRLRETGSMVDRSQIPVEALKDLYRVEAALHTLQGNCGLSFDSAAQKAVKSILNRHEHRPSARQQEIAKTQATDQNTVMIREHVTKTLALWQENVATAEALVLKLELDAEASKAKHSSVDSDVVGQLG